MIGWSLSTAATRKCIPKLPRRWWKASLRNRFCVLVSQPAPFLMPRGAKTHGLPNNTNATRKHQLTRFCALTGAAFAAWTCGPLMAAGLPCGLMSPRPDNKSRHSMRLMPRWTKRRGHSTGLLQAQMSAPGNGRWSLKGCVSAVIMHRCWAIPHPSWARHQMKCSACLFTLMTWQYWIQRKRQISTNRRMALNQCKSTSFACATKTDHGSGSFPALR